MKHLILDKDGTLVTPKSGEAFVQHPEDQVLIPGLLEILRQYKSAGWTISIATNQGGVLANYKTLKNVKLEVEYCIELLGGMVDHAAFCPDVGSTAWEWIHYLNTWMKHTSYSLYPFRKPGCGMLKLLDSGRPILFVGDRPEDQGAAQAMKCDFMWASDFLRNER